MRMAHQQEVAVVVKIADDRDIHAGIGDARCDFRDGGCRFIRIHRDTHQLRTGVRQRDDLSCRAGGVRRIGVGHRLHDDRMSRTNRDITDPHRYGLSSSLKRHFAASIS
jgi:hypothetical protein